MTGMVSPAADTIRGSFGPNCFTPDKSGMTHSCTRDMEDPESNIMSTSLLLNCPLMTASLVRMAAMTIKSLATLGGPTVSWSVLGP